MPLVDLVGQGDGAATGAAAVPLNLALSGQGDAAATGAAGIALNLTLVGQSDGAAAGPSVTGGCARSAKQPRCRSPAHRPCRRDELGDCHPDPAFASGWRRSSQGIGPRRRPGRGSAVCRCGIDGQLRRKQRDTELRPYRSPYAPSPLCGESSNRARAIRNRLFNVQADGQASGNAGLTV